MNHINRIKRDNEKALAHGQCFFAVHLFTEPLSLVKQFAYALNGSSILFIIWLTFLQCIVWWLFVDRKRSGL
ncbi:Protein of unknown function [Bacillus wiedmannii]|uniref:Uncharacterized protein n=1 Tax=Bacillus wiedmannii TaxID=1890302 RepID=A0A1C4GE89_9BACI|nr:Protein of unknown function [Bacillus wiedmannii]